jgi:hypothetical protein
MIVKAKDQVNEAFNVLFNKDSFLHQVKSLKEATTSAVSFPEPQKPSLQTEQLRLGSLRTSGLPLLKKVVTLNESSLRTLQQNLTVFA